MLATFLYSAGDNGEKGCATTRRRSKPKAIVSSLNTNNECEIENGNRKMNEDSHTLTHTQIHMCKE